MTKTMVAQTSFELAGAWYAPGDRVTVDDDAVDDLFRYGYATVADTGVETSSDTERGSATFSGDGAVTTFTVSHSLGSAPSQAFVEATSVDARDAFPVQITNETSTGFDIVCSTAPVAGTDNVTLYYQAFV